MPVSSPCRVSDKSPRRPRPLSQAMAWLGLSDDVISSHEPMTRQTSVHISGASQANGDGAASSSLLRKCRTQSLPSNLDGSDTSHLPPLQRFTRAKQDIITIFTRLGNSLKETAAYLAKPRTYLEHRAGQAAVVHEVEYADEKQRIESDSVKCKGITDAVSRNVMKVVFVGRTSNGKSTSINAMLHAKVLPSTIGNTTNCFLRLNGIEEDKPYVLLAATNEKRDVSELGLLSNALFPEHHLSDASVIDVFWPRDKCFLLKDDVHIIDSPGLDVSQNFDAWIDEHCMDADVFVLVSNSESTLNMTEKKFFERVTAKLSKPNVFIEYNRWDCVDQESDKDIIQRVRGQHERNAQKFLCEELKLMDDPARIRDRVFFVSAREVVNYRSKNPGAAFVGEESAVERYREFERFESEFEKCISASAIKTRFMHHAREGLGIALNLDRIISSIAAATEAQKLSMSEFLNDQRRRLRHLQNNKEAAAEASKRAVDDVADRIRSVVLNNMQEIVRDKLMKIIEDFKEYRFALENIGEYKARLNSYVEYRLHEALKIACHKTIQDEFNNTQVEICDRILELLPPGVTLPSAPLSNPIELSLDCGALTENFREDLAFRFSLNISRLVPQIAKANMNEAMGVLLPVGFAASIRENEPWTLQRVLSLSLAFFQSPAGWISMALSSFFLKRTWGWYLVGGGTAICAAVYGYERFFYDKAAKERKFRLQYLEHATKELHTMARQTSFYARQSSYQELTRLLTDILSKVESTEEQLRNDILEHEKELVDLQANAAKAEELHKSSRALSMDFELFLNRYINTNDEDAEDCFPPH